MRRVLMAATTVAVLLLAACGGGDSGSKVPTAAGAGSGGRTTTTRPNQQASEEEILAYFACLRKNGVDVPDPKFDADGHVDFSGGNRGTFRSIDRTAMQKAQKACGPFPNMGFGNRNREQRQDDLLALAKCMRRNGVDMPDPDFDKAPGEGGPFGGNGINRDDPKVRAALDKCRKTLNLPDRRGDT